MKRVLRLVTGRAPAAPGAHFALATALASHALKIGLVFKRMEVSRCTVSPSRYLHLADAGGRAWLIRVSDHARTDATGHLRPHVDLVSLDGVAGLDAGRDILDRIARGELAWHAPERDPARRRG